jgi:hypothetical protein
MEQSSHAVGKMIGVFLLALLVGGAFFHKNVRSTTADLLSGATADFLSGATFTDEEREGFKDPAAAHKAAYDKITRELQERQQATQREANDQSWRRPVVGTRPRHPWQWHWKK